MRRWSARQIALSTASNVMSPSTATSLRRLLWLAALVRDASGTSTLGPADSACWPAHSRSLQHIILVTCRAHPQLQSSRQAAERCPWLTFISVLDRGANVDALRVLLSPAEAPLCVGLQRAAIWQGHRSCLPPTSDIRQSPVEQMPTCSLLSLPSYGEAQGLICISK